MAVYTKVSDSEAAAFLGAYDVGELRGLFGIKQGIDNTNFLLTTTQGRFILTLYEKRLRRDEIPFFAQLLTHLSGRGLPCPAPVPGRDGEVLRVLNGRPAMIVSFLDGATPNPITPEHCGEVGRGLAQLHRAGEGFPLERPNTLGQAAWAALFAKSEARTDEVRQGLGDVVRNELAFLSQHWPNDLPRGVIHADFFADNVFFDGAKLCGMIDFYFACSDALVYDLAITFNAWCFERDVAFNITKARALLRGYEAARPLSAAERTALPILLRGASMRFLLTRLHDWLNQVPGALVKPHDPLKYLTRLQFFQQTTTLAAYGFDA